jgi:hypothetical protein
MLIHITNLARELPATFYNPYHHRRRCTRAIVLVLVLILVSIHSHCS